MIKETTPIADEMRVHWDKFIDTHHFVNASRGYAHNQYNKFYNFEGPGIKGQERTSKFAISFLRVMWQCEQFLLTGKFKCNLEESDLYPLMKKIKPLSKEEIQPLIPEVFGKMAEMNNRVSYAEANALPEVMAMKPDLEWVEDFIYRSYMISDMQGQPETTIQDYLDAYERGELTATELNKIIKNSK
jgi:hypothetical protein